MKGSRESIKKVPSKNISREKVDEKQSILTQDSSPCSSYLGRELEHYDRILRKVHLDIDLARKDVGGQSETNISEKSLILLA